MVSSTTKQIVICSWVEYTLCVCVCVFPWLGKAMGEGMTHCHTQVYQRKVLTAFIKITRSSPKSLMHHKEANAKTLHATLGSARMKQY